MQGYKQETIIKLKDTDCLDIEILNLFVSCILVSLYLFYLSFEL
jgi:hypothetical protein